MNKNVLDFTKPLQTKDGRKVEILATDLSGLYPIIAKITENDGYKIVFCYTPEGNYLRGSSPSHHDLIQAPETRKIWLNIYKEWHSSHDTKENADFSATSKRLACVSVEVKYSRGEGL